MQGSGKCEAGAPGAVRNLAGHHAAPSGHSGTGAQGWKVKTLGCVGGHHASPSGNRGTGVVMQGDEVQGQVHSMAHRQQSPQPLLHCPCDRNTATVPLEEENVLPLA